MVMAGTDAVGGERDGAEGVSTTGTRTQGSPTQGSPSCTDRPRYGDAAGEQVDRVEVLLTTVRDTLASLARTSSALEREVARALPPAPGRPAAPAADGAHHTVDCAALTTRNQQLAEEVAQLREALESRAVIEQAKGVLMARHGCTADQAFALLGAVSRRRHRKVRAVAAAVVQEAARPPASGAPHRAPADAPASGTRRSGSAPIPRGTTGTGLTGPRQSRGARIPPGPEPVPSAATGGTPGADGSR